MADPWPGEVVLGLKILHVFFAATWVGTALYSNLVVMPNLRQATPGTRREFGGRILPSAIRFGNIVGGSTLLSGALLLYGLQGDFTFEGTWGRLVALALIGNLAALYLLNFALRPSLRAIDKIMAKQAEPDLPPPQVVLFLQRRMAITGWFIVVLLVGVLVAMVAANGLGLVS